MDAAAAAANDNDDDDVQEFNVRSKADGNQFCLTHKCTCKNPLHFNYCHFLTVFVIFQRMPLVGADCRR